MCLTRFKVRIQARSIRTKTLIIELLYSYCKLYSSLSLSFELNLDLIGCDQIGLLLKELCNKFSYKSSPTYWAIMKSDPF